MYIFGFGMRIVSPPSSIISSSSSSESVGMSESADSGVIDIGVSAFDGPATGASAMSCHGLQADVKFYRSLRLFAQL